MDKDFNLGWWIAVIGVPLVGSIFATIAVVYNAGAQGRKELHGRLDKISADFYQYKEQAALLFSTVALTREVKTDLKETIKAGFDTLAERLDGVEQDLRDLVGRNSGRPHQR
jgi:hypothetical protein